MDLHPDRAHALILPLCDETLKDLARYLPAGVRKVFMILIRSGFGIAALAVGIVAGFLLYRTPSQMNRLGEDAFRASSNGNITKAIEAYSEQIRRRPQDYVLYLRRGLTEKQSGDLAAAITDFDEALQRIPQPATADELGQRLYNSGLPETHVHNLAVELYSERANAFEKLGRIDEALSDLDSAVALNGRLPAIVERRATLRLLTGQIENARTDFNAVLDRGMNGDAVFGRGLTAYFSGDWATAATDFAQALRVNPRSGAYALWLLKAQLRAHQPIPLDEFKGVPASNSAWPWINAFLGDYDGGSIATGLRDGAGGDPVRACETTHLLGEWFLLKGNPEQAAIAFRAVSETCPPLTVQRVAAAAELRRLEQHAQPLRPVNGRK